MVIKNVKLVKEVYFQFDELHPDLQGQFYDCISTLFPVELTNEADWVNKLLDNINFTHQFHVSLFHEAFTSGSPDLSKDPKAILFVKLHEVTIYGDNSEHYYHSFVSSWDTTKEPSILILKGFSQEDVESLLDQFKSEFSLMEME